MPQTFPSSQHGARDLLLARVTFDVIWERSPDSETVFWGDGIETLFGYPRAEVVNNVAWWRERVHPEDGERVERTADEAMAGTAHGWSSQYRFRRKDGSWAWVAGRGAIERDERGAAVRVVGAMVDITERVRQEEEIRMGEQRLRSVLETLPVGVVVMNKAGDIMFDNPAARRIWGEMIASGAERWERSKGHYRESGKPVGPGEWASQRALRTGEACLDELIDIETFDGASKTIRNGAVAIRDAEGVVTGAIVVNEDITERTRVAMELEQNREQLQTLSRKLIEAQEAERRAVARELHDDLGQVLTAIKLNLQRRERDQAESMALVDGAIARMRDLAHDLRPPLLDELGLEASLRWYLERETTRAGLRFDLTCAAFGPRSPAAVETTCFRVVQESVTNIIRHAKARHVAVELCDVGGALVLTVRDDGVGFDVAAARKRAHCQGLLGMKERVALVGGDLRIESGPRGTLVRAVLPPSRGA